MDIGYLLILMEKNLLKRFMKVLKDKLNRVFAGKLIKKKSYKLCVKWKFYHNSFNS